MAGSAASGTTEHTAGEPQQSPTKSKFVSMIFGLWGLLWTSLGISIAAYADSVADWPVDDAQEAAEVFLLIALAFFVLAVIDFAVGYGIWRRSTWGWYAGFAISGLSTLLWFGTLLAGGDLSDAILLVVSAGCAWALWDEMGCFRGEG